jgi:hypothetical protein
MHPVGYANIFHCELKEISLESMHIESWSPQFATVANVNISEGLVRQPLIIYVSLHNKSCR